MTDQILFNGNGRILEATFNRSEDNACSDAMAAEFSYQISKAHETADMVLLRSCGPDFCTGRVRNADAGPPDPEAYIRRDEYDSIFYCYSAIKNCKIPVVAVIEGRCMGFGTAVAAVCDVTIAARSAQFNIPEMNHNVMPTMVMSALYNRISRNAILWMTYTAKFISADQAMSYGIISTIAEDKDLESEVSDFCNILLSRKRPAIVGLKEYLSSAPYMDDRGALDYARALHSMVNTASAMKN